jgi:hypothetical protein
LDPDAHGHRADGAGDRGQHQAARERGEDRAGVVVGLEELGELDHADDGEDQRQPEVGAYRAHLQLPVDEEGEDGDADQQVHGSRGVHDLNASALPRAAQCLSS